MSPGATAGYSGTPLPKKLGIKPNHRVGLVNPPRGLESTLGELPPGSTLGPASRSRGQDVLLLFAETKEALDTSLRTTKARMAPTTALWICWPKKTSPLASNLDEGGVRSAGLGAGLVDIKICAVDQDWSGLKFVYRLKDRPARKAKKK